MKPKKIVMRRLSTESNPLSISSTQEGSVSYTPQQAMEVKDAFVQHDIAKNFPELRKYLAQNPNCYAELIEWLANLGDPQINEALQKRRAEQGQDPTL